MYMCTGIFSHNSPPLHPPSCSLCIVTSIHDNLHVHVLLCTLYFFMCFPYVSPLPHVCFSGPSYHPVIHNLLPFPSHIRHIGTMLHHLSLHLVIFCMALSLPQKAFGQGSTGHTVSLVNKLCICFHSSPVDVYSYVNERSVTLNCDCPSSCSWRLNGTEIDYRSPLYLLPPSRFLLQIISVNVTDEGTYTCQTLSYSLVVPGMLTIALCIRG